MSARPRLVWSDYKSDHGSLTVWFPGGFQLNVNRRDANWKLCDEWRVWWGDGHPVTPEMEALYRRRFKTRLAAQLAAEALFVPMCLLAVELVAIPRSARNAVATAEEAFKRYPRARP